MRWLICWIWLIFLPVPTFSQENAQLLIADSSVTADGDDLLISLKLTQPAPYRPYMIDEPKRLVIDMQGVGGGNITFDKLNKAGLFTSLRSGKSRAGWMRLIFELSKPYDISESWMNTKGENRATLNLRLTPVSAEDYTGSLNAMSALWSLPQPTTASVDPTRPRPLRIAIDPGHGGIDSGAVVKNLRESSLMLDFGRELTEKLIRSGFEVVMTRHKNIFIGLEARMTEARASHADILISLHADALPDEQAAGAAIFIWNSKADDRASRQLATRHDRADLVAGLDLAGTDDQIAETLMDMARADTQPRSEALAQYISSTLAQKGLALHRNPVKGAAFSVLKSPDIPSVLIELGFLTDQKDRGNLTSPEWRAKMAEAIADAVKGWSEDDAALATLRRH